MITESPSVVDGLLTAAASAAIASLTAGEALVAGESSATFDATVFATAILAPFTGSLTGELVLFVDSEVSEALTSSSIGALDVAAALAPTLDAIARAIGPVALGNPLTLEPRLAESRVMSHSGASAVVLHGSSSVRAAIAVGIDVSADSERGKPVIAPENFERLDLLRGVEMAASAELGRARMTVDELLSLRNGAVIELDRAAGEPADLYVNGRLIARGEVVVVDENYGLRITQVVSVDGGR